MTDLSYTKGMLFFYHLYRTTGEAAFMKTINDYYHLYRNKGTKIEDFSNHLIKELKNKKIDLLVNDWILTSESSKYIQNKKSLEDLIE
jgi:aminopeptidase N